MPPAAERAALYCPEGDWARVQAALGSALGPTLRAIGDALVADVVFDEASESR